MYVIFRLLRFPMMATGSIFSTFQPDSSSIVCLLSLSLSFFVQVSSYDLEEIVMMLLSQCFNLSLGKKSEKKNFG